ncbi:MAG: hypothetical protein IH933_02595 [Euryarchaeota archaeon]|nr:hypothetical protein [Euryarchaeota archaeon]
MDEPDSGPIDRQILRLLDRKLERYPLVESTRYDPDPYEPRQLHALFVGDRYPSSVESARIEIRWFEAGDFGFHYVEEDEESTWHCRWDRHPNPHNSRNHFHEPPDCVSVIDLSFSETNPVPLLFTVLSAIEERIDQLWD